MTNQNHISPTVHSSAVQPNSTSLSRKRGLDSSNDDDFESHKIDGLETSAHTLVSELDAVDSVSDDKSFMVAVEALGKLKNSSTSSVSSSTANSSVSPPSTPAAIGTATLENLHLLDNSNTNSSIPNKNCQPHYQRRFFNTVSNYYKSSKDFSPTFKVGAEFVEKTAIPIVRKFEQRFPNSSISNIRNNIIRLNGDQLQRTFNTLNSDQRSFSYLQSQQQKLQNFNLSVSIESKKNLKVLLKILKLANNRLSTGVDNLQHLIALKEQRLPNKNGDEAVSDDDTGGVAKTVAAGSKRQKITKRQDGLNQVKKDIVVTVKKAVTVISKFTGNSLPEPARTNVRDVLLKLPENLSKALNTDLEELQTPNSSAPGSPVLNAINTSGNTSIPSSPLSTNNPNKNGVLPASPATSTNTNINNFLQFHKIDPNFTNRKILILAKESLDSFANIIKIFDANLNKMDDWVEVERQKEITKLKQLSGSLANANGAVPAIPSALSTSTSVNNEFVGEHREMQPKEQDSNVSAK